MTTIKEILIKFTEILENNIDIKKFNKNYNNLELILSNGDKIKLYNKFGLEFFKFVVCDKNLKEALNKFINCPECDVEYYSALWDFTDENKVITVISSFTDPDSYIEVVGDLGKVIYDTVKIIDGFNLIDWKNYENMNYSFKKWIKAFS